MLFNIYLKLFDSNSGKFGSFHMVINFFLHIFQINQLWMNIDTTSRSNWTLNKADSDQLKLDDKKLNSPNQSNEVTAKSTDASSTSGTNLIISMMNFPMIFNQFTAFKYEAKV